MFSKKEMLTVTRNLQVGINMRGDKVRKIRLGSRLCRGFFCFLIERHIVIFRFSIQSVHNCHLNYLKNISVQAQLRDT